MIGLVNLLEQTQQTDQKKAILFAGPCGSGKSTIIKNYIPTDYQKYVINPDTYYEKVLGPQIDQSKFTPDQVKTSNTAMSKAQQQARIKFNQAVTNGTPIILDVTGGQEDQVLNKKQILESAGYKVMMIMVYASPLTTLSRNSNRTRKLKPSIVLRSWLDVVSNIKQYMGVFNEENFTVVDSDPISTGRGFSFNQIKQYFKSISTQEQKVLEVQINRLMDDCKSLPFVAFDELDSKIKNFLIPHGNGPEE